jgi:hypothetical protein
MGSGQRSERNMGDFDGTVQKVVRMIAETRREQQQRAASVTTTAENMFGNVRKMILELNAALAARFPELQPSVSMEGWSEIDDRVVNTIKLKKADGEKDITLSFKFGESEVLVNGDRFYDHGVVDVIATEIAHFFKDGGGQLAGYVIDVGK